MELKTVSVNTIPTEGGVISVICPVCNTKRELAVALYKNCPRGGTTMICHHCKNLLSIVYEKEECSNENKA